MRPPAKAAPIALQPRDLLGRALDRKGAERCVFVADRLGGFVLRRIVSRDRRIETLEGVDDDAVLRRISVESHGLATTGESFVPSTCTERFHRDRSKLLQEAVLILHVYFSNNVADRLCLRMKALDRSSTKDRTREHRQSDCEISFHSVSPLLLPLIRQAHYTTILK